MSLSEGDMSFARELFNDIPDLKSRRMFGGMGLYSGPTIFAVQLSDGRLMLKAKGVFAKRMKALGGEEWTYERKDGKQSACPTGPCPTPLSMIPKRPAPLRGRPWMHSLLKV